jgi:hypothetical protein
MAIAFKFGISDLLPELLADALILLSTFQTAGAITAGAFQSVFDDLNHFLIFV